MDWRAWVSGGVAGVSLSIMGHPFDTIKTRMQTNPSHRSAFACATTMARQEGVLSLWKGISPAIAAGVLTGSIRFGVQSWANRTLARNMGVHDFADLNLGARVFSESMGGWVAGMVLPILFTPLEMVKCWQQVHVVANTKPLGTLHILGDVLLKEGLRGLYVGHAMTTRVSRARSVESVGRVCRVGWVGQWSRRRHRQVETVRLSHTPLRSYPECRR